MKYFKKFAKLLTFCAIGAVLGFVSIFITSYMKASAVAGDISRNALLLATQDGCINANTATQFCTNMAESYGTKDLLVSNRVKTDADDLGTARRYFAQDLEGDVPWDPIVHGAGNTTCGLIWVEDSAGNTLLNTTGNDYVHHVQRGDTINVTATVEVNIHLNFIMTSNGDTGETMRLSVPVSAEATGISCKWFKGEN